MENQDNVAFCDLLAEVVPLYHQAMNNSFSEQEVTPVQASVLFALEEQGRMKVTELAEQLDTPTSNISNIATRLEKMNLLVRQRNEADKRIVELELTPEAPQELVKLHKAKNDFFVRVESSKPDVDFAKLNQSLQQIKEILTGI